MAKLILLRPWIIGGLMSLCMSATPAQWTDSGAFVTQVQGAVQMEPRADAQEVRAFAHLQAGQTLVLTAQARLQVLYLQGGRQETWFGPAQLKLGEAQSQLLSGTAPQIKSLPPAVVQALGKTHELMSDPKARQGMIRFRAIPAAKVREAQEQYGQLREQLPFEDITPELFLLGQLEILRAYSAMRAPLREMLLRQPQQPEVRALHDQYSAMLDEARP